MRKQYPVFDCDAHINDPLDIWEKYVPESKKEQVRNAYYRTEDSCTVNGTEQAIGGGREEFAPNYDPIAIAGPYMNKKIMRRLQSMNPLTQEQRDYLYHDGADDPQARARDLDLAGIDQVLVVPTMVLMNVPFVEDVEAADIFCQAYNNFAQDWCSQVPGRLYGAALLPAQDPELTAKEIERLADSLDLMPVALIRPIDAQGKYPNDLGSGLAMGPMARFMGPNWDATFRTFEETGIVCGMHTFPAPGRSSPLGANFVTSPGDLVTLAGVDSQTFSFIYEAQAWLAQVLLSGMLDRYPKLRMAIYESNSQWIPSFLAQCDRMVKLYANERNRMIRLERLPSEAFFDQCVISFESDEAPTIRQWKTFEDNAIWASDMYHHDASDAWSAMRLMDEVGVPVEAQAKLMGGNACRFYGIDPKVFIEEETGPLPRPDWFPQGPEFEEWAELVEEPRRNREKLRERGYDPMSMMAAMMQRRAAAAAETES